MISFVYRSFIFWMCSISLMGCANYNYSDIDGTYYNQHNTDKLLAYFYDISTFSSERLKEEYEKIQREYSADRSYYNAVRLSLVLILPDSDFYDKARSIRILEESFQEQSEDNKSIINLIFLLKYFYNESYNNEMLYNITNKKLTRTIEEKRKQQMLYEKISNDFNKINKEREKRDVLHKKLHEKLNEKEQTVEKLQKTIEDLKAIERSINKRKNVKAPST